MRIDSFSINAMILLALDIGNQKTGAAVSSGVVGRGLITLSTRDLSRQLPEICEEYQIEKIIIGLPSTGNQAIRIKQIVDSFKKEIKVPVQYEDETLTTVAGRNQAGDLHQAAAVIILEQYLNDRKRA